jgi:pimeloyl-ACP methyl ester carboxylesterase
MKAPGLVRMALEGRAPWEHAAFAASWPFRKQAAAGDGHAVLVLPGFVAGDNSTYLLRHFLTDRGYQANGWKQGRNLGPKPGVLETSLDHLQAMAKESGRKVSIVGWSLGGIYARELAKMAPDLVRRVITLGSPFGGPGNATNAWWLYRTFNPEHQDVEQRVAQLHVPPPVACTALFSRTDGVVSWQAASFTQEQLNERSDLENIEVEASHIGMGASPLALYVIADRLAQPEGQFRPFNRHGWKQLVYRDPARKTLFF